MNPMKCPKCPTRGKGHVVKYRSRADVIIHLKKSHNIEFYYCDECEDEFENKDVHKIFHLNYPHHCQYCTRVYSVVDCLLDHVKTEHPEVVGLHSRQPGVTINTEKLPCRGDELMRRAQAIGLRPDIRLVSKDYFVVGLEGGLPKVSIHAVTPRATNPGNKCSRKNWPRRLLRRGKDVAHLCSASDFKYDEDAHLASYDDLNYVYLDPSTNRSQLSGLEKFVGFSLSRKWDEILTITAVNYRTDGTEQREVSEIGKAYLMTRDGEPPKVLCYIFQNQTSSLPFTRRKATLQKFREEFNLPKLLADIPELNECGNATVYKCKWLRCVSVFLSSSARDQHQQSCPIKNDPKAQQRKTVDDIHVPCLNCKKIANDNWSLKSHIRTMHRDNPQQDSSSLGNTSVQSDPNQNMRKRPCPDSSKMEIPSTVSQPTEDHDAKAKVIKLIEIHPFTDEDLDEIMEVIVNKKTKNTLT